MSPLLYQLSYTARKDGMQSQQDTGMVWRVSSPHYSPRATGGTGGKSVIRISKNVEPLSVPPVALFPPVSPFSLESDIRYSPVGSVPSFR
jgi:hypothetical protein